MFAVGGLFLALNGFPWPLCVVLAALIGLGVAAGAAFSIAAWYALRAPYGQRDEARAYAQALEAHIHEYAEWARRREMAYEFKQNTLEDVRRLSDEGNVMGSVEYEEERWRSYIVAIRGQMEAHGAGASELGLLDTQMEALDSRDDGYGDNHLGRIRNSMATTCQNLWSEVIRQHEPPAAPTPPTEGSDQ